MQIIKKIGNIKAFINIHKNELQIELEDILNDIFISMENTIIVDKKIKPEKLMEINQSGKKPILADNPKNLDEIKILLKLISNFFIYTQQTTFFTLESIELEYKNNTIIAFGSEIYQGDLNDLTFSPLIRAKWKNQKIMNALIQLG